MNMANRHFTLFAAYLLGGAMAVANAQTSRAASFTCNPKANGAQTMNQNKHVGMWVTADGHIRHELLAGGRYDEARGVKKSAYQGQYCIEKDHITYRDDTGFSADGDFRNGVLHHAGMILYRETTK